MGRLSLLVRRQCPGRHPLLPPLRCRGLLAGGTKPGCTGGPPRLLRRESLLPLVWGGSSYLWTRRPFDSCVGAGGVSRLIEPVGGEWWFLLFL